MLRKAPKLCGHNIIGYDLPVIRKLYPDFDWKGDTVDTMVLSRVAYPEIKIGDYSRHRKGLLPAKLIGSYSLKAWGYRLGELKGDFSEDTDWQDWSPEMSRYSTIKTSFIDRV